MAVQASRQRNESVVAHCVSLTSTILSRNTCKGVSYTTPANYRSKHTSRELDSGQWQAGNMHTQLPDAELTGWQPKKWQLTAQVSMIPLPHGYKLRAC
jgi:hypothetical protein